MSTSVLVRGRETESLDRAALESLPHETQEVEVSCASGSGYESTWVGVSLETLLDAGGSPPETTHIAVTAADGCHVLVEIRDALSGILAIEQDGSPLETPRLVVPGLDGMRSVKDVVEIEAVSLAADTDPLELERHPKVDDGDS